MAYLLATLAAVFYGAADFTGGMVTKRVATVPVVLLSQATGLVMVALILPFLGTAAPRAADLWWGAAGGLAGGVGVALLYYGLAIGTMSVVAPTTAVLAVAIPVLTSIALGERPGWLAIAGILLGIGAIALVSRPTANPQSTARRSGLGVALVAGVAIGLFLLALAQTRPASGLWPLLTARLTSVGLFAVIAAVGRRSVRMPLKLAAIAVGGGALDMLANTLYLLAAQIGPLSPVVTLSALYPASTVLLARAVLGERLNAWQTAGVAAALVAVLLIVRGG
ncbi:MAG: EamA/RhaT family transporter [Gemmatimonadetes bacterium]|nr:MAG: EamA/RhaT family transporter [Gemmatimonadota bacterium]